MIRQRRRMKIFGKVIANGAILIALVISCIIFEWFYYFWSKPQTDSISKAELSFLIIPMIFYVGYIALFTWVCKKEMPRNQTSWDDLIVLWFTLSVVTILFNNIPWITITIVNNTLNSSWRIQYSLWTFILNASCLAYSLSIFPICWKVFEKVDANGNGNYWP